MAVLAGKAFVLSLQQKRTTMNNNNFLQLISTLILMFCLTGCAVVGGIFKAGMIWGILLVVLIVFGIIYLISRGGGNKGA
jgi:hypothetical protein